MYDDPEHVVPDRGGRTEVALSGGTIESYGPLVRRLLLRYAAPALAAVIIVAFVGVPYLDRMLADWFRSDVQLRASAVMGSIREPLAELLSRDDLGRAGAYLDRVSGDSRLLGAVVCGPADLMIVQTAAVPQGVGCTRSAPLSEDGFFEVRTPAGLAGVFGFPLLLADGSTYSVLLVNDLGYIDRRQTRARTFVLAALVIGLGALAALGGIGFRLLLYRWLGMLLGDLRERRFLDDASTSRSASPVLVRVRDLLKELEERQRQEIEYQENWTQQALQRVVHDHLPDAAMIVVSNREPYMHNLGPDGQVVVQVPASGMVTAMEPVMRACTGVWVAHGSGSADRQTVDSADRVAVPPGQPLYALRRVWLTEEEEQGYYYGFSNEGLWPLCHLAYVRPAFRESDWRHYVTVNRRFADAVVQEAAGREPVVLVQDYHFALLPKMIRERSPRASIAVFWHIPWPNAETFGVCPWKRELLAHLLQADILGFHTLQHCRNFLDTVDRQLECQIDHERMTVTVQGHECRVFAYPISIEWPPRWLAGTPEVPEARRRVRERLGVGADVRIGLGVERWDFTKGIIERVQAIEFLLDQKPALRGRLTFLQVAAPSRSKLPSYRALQEQTIAEVERVNARFATGNWRPIVLLATHHEPTQVFELYRAADFLLVNSLHDGMNLVAKEYVAARDDEDGVLILSSFAGASREMPEALIVNPYDIGETARAVEAALNMDREERRQRMRLMRHTVAENNVYRWAGRMLIDIARTRQRRSLGNWQHTR